MGFTLFQMPVPGLRKSGMPDSVLIPAPVKTTTRRAASNSRRISSSRSTFASFFIIG